MVAKWNGEVIGEVNGAKLGESEMGVRLGQWLVARLEVPEPRLGAHADRDPRAERGNLLLDIYHKS